LIDQLNFSLNECPDCAFSGLNFGMTVIRFFIATMNLNELKQNFDHFRFLTAERQPVYLAILYALFQERLAHQIEIFHDSLYDQVATAIEDLSGNDYPEMLFRQDIDQLVNWGNITRKLESRRVRSLTDNSLRRNILKITEETFQLLRFLIEQSRPKAARTAARGFLLLQDLSSMLEEFEAIIEKYYGDDQGEILLQRALHIIEGMDAKIDDAVAELTGLADQLHSFLDSRQFFDHENFDKLMAQLESYNKSYLSRLTKVANQVFSRLRDLVRHPCFDELFTEVMKLANQDNPAGSSPEDRFRILLSFFDPESGKLHFYCRRVQTELYDALHRIHNYMRIRQDKTLRIANIRSRLAEMSSATIIEASTWLERLFSPGVVPMLNGDGTPIEKILAPLPRRNATKMRQKLSAQEIAEKSTSLEKSRELERQRIQRLNEFFAEKVLRGKSSGQTDKASLNTVDDLKNYLKGVKLSYSSKRLRKAYFEFAFERPEKEDKAASFSNDSFEFSCPNHLIRSKSDDR
jgi:ElaB/YqjD/DUF883 family membrane-anchored ribosome-binding protein